MKTSIGGLCLAILESLLWCFVLTIAGISSLVVLYQSVCGISVHSTVPSPNGTMSAVIFRVGCYSGSGHFLSYLYESIPATQVGVVQAGHDFFDEDMWRPLIISGSYSLAIRWIDNKTIEIAIPKSAEVFRKFDEAGDIKILYTH